MSEYRYESLKAGGGAYTVFSGSTLLGFIHKAERRYELKRPIVVRGWMAQIPAGRYIRVGRSTDAMIYRTRDEAAGALWSLMMRGG